MEKSVLSKCRCPICTADDAELRLNKNGRAYIVCDDCVSLCRTSSRRGDVAMRAMATGKPNTSPVVAAGDPAGAGALKERDPAPDNKPAPADKAEPKKKRGFADAFDVLTGAGNG